MPAETTEETTKQTAERQLGTTTFPLARIKRLIKEDKDISLISTDATFCITYAAELFIEYLVSEALDKAKQEKRKSVFYKDLAKVVKDVEPFEFLEDVIPTTMTLKAAIEKRKQVLNEDTPAKKQKTDPVQEEEEEDEDEEENKMEEDTAMEENTEQKELKS
ncbi:hypothetical protein G6F70_000225 [Rhizopus microsporus]|uniref:Histone-fold-containing protein n=1 Tax=Rhizopus microsporus TaxID=58291 RepID=A0A0A1NV18_RHIZD|nr:hypothetical protein G6F71_001651 [Rhizopus microsporus]KAG1204773.1 hypothetical protein G6F70_000225 [Rhizopus microsporus]KAG1210870.1 hypothetical protein G6F69_005089 [Rhizopus microsporus]KAG1238183.1 hypothetical protein G6F67_000646 [Rhizopus microsporus]KAG1264868.1 hypothetical protein G6F68_004028 [Rhizopus microsporus]